MTQDYRRRQFMRMVGVAGAGSALVGTAGAASAAAGISTRTLDELRRSPRRFSRSLRSEASLAALARPRPASGRPRSRSRRRPIDRLSRN